MNKRRKVSVDEVVGISEHHILRRELTRGGQPYRVLRALVPDTCRGAGVWPFAVRRRWKVDFDEDSALRQRESRSAITDKDHYVVVGRLSGERRQSILQLCFDAAVVCGVLWVTQGGDEREHRVCSPPKAQADGLIDCRKHS